MKIINIIESTSALQGSLLVVGIIGSMLSLCLIAWAFADNQTLRTKAIAILVMMLSVACLIGCGISCQVHPYIEYEVLIDDMESISDEYHIISQRGEIYTVRLKDQPLL